ncbi:MAG: molybdenum cofactor biosynthesis protein MoaE [Armatimonadetes bacterium]|nr:molybdenum cofactor biosynthesis protein MoaE [Armatimonadota bacterium]
MSKAIITREAIDATVLCRLVARPEHGAVALFLGVTRNHSRGRSVSRLEYEAYEEMAIKQIENLIEESEHRWPVVSAIAHRLGEVPLGETSVAIAAGSAHRADAFEAARWLIDALKQDVPIWKREFTDDGAYWIEGDAAVFEGR